MPVQIHGLWILFLVQKNETLVNGHRGSSKFKLYHIRMRRRYPGISDCQIVVAQKLRGGEFTR